MQHSRVKQDCPNSTPIAVFAKSCRAQGGMQEENAAELIHVSVWDSSGQCLLLKSIFELVVLFLSRVAGGCERYFYSIELNITPKSEKRYLGSYTKCPKSRSQYPKSN